MPDPGSSRRLLVLGGLYVAQGLPFGFFNQALPVLLRQGGASLSAVTAVNLLALPWALKFLWAGWFDRPSMRTPPARRRAVLVLQGLSVALLLALAAGDPGSALGLVLAGVFLANALAATQDVATDGLAVDALPAAERGLANGVQVGGYRLGMVVGGGALLMVLERQGWGLTLVGLATLLAVATLPLLLVGPLPRAAAAPLAEAPARLRDWLATRPARDWIALLLLYKAGDAFGTGVVKPMLVDLGVSLGGIGALMGLLGSGMAIFGAAFGGWLGSRVGAWALLPRFAGLQAGAVALWGVVAAWPSASLWTLATAVEHFVSAMATAALFAAMMDQCRPHRGASDYTLQASVVVVAQGCAAVLSGVSAEHLGYVGHLALATVWAAFAVGAAARAPRRVWSAAPADEPQ